MRDYRQRRFVCLLARCEPTQAQMAEAALLAPGPAEWPALLEELEQHGVAPLIWHNLSDSLRLGVPKPQQERFQQVRGGTIAFHMRATIVCQKVFDALAARGVETVPLKGMALVDQVYRRPDLRTFTDVDLFIPPRALATASEVVGQLGKRWTPETRLDEARFEMNFVVDGVLVELHRAFAQPERYPIDYDEMLSRCRAAKVFGRDTRVLSPEDTLLQLCVHAATHYFVTHFKWIVDLHEVTQRLSIDWPALVCLASQSRATAVCYVGLTAAKRMLGTPVPNDVLTALRPAWVRRGLLGAALDTRSPQVSRVSGPKWLLQAMLLLPLCDRPISVLPFVLKHEWMRLLDRVRPLDRGDGAGSQ